MGTTSADNILSNDYLFFLSYDEACKSEYFPNDSNRIANLNGNAVWWWLRSPYYDYIVDCVNDLGTIYGPNVRRADPAARPAFNLNLSSVLFTSAAKGGKSSTAAAGGGTGIFENVDLSTLTDNDGYKLTMLDESRKFTVTEEKITAPKGGSATISYENAKTDTNEYISAMLLNEDEEVLYYGQIKNVASSSEADGKATVEIPASVNTGTYTLRVFNEQINGDYKTDFSSDFKTIELNVLPKASFTTQPTANTLTYDGTEQALVTAGVTSDGTVKYSLSENGTYSENIPTAKNADTYTVWYYIEGDSNHSDSDKTSIEVTIAKADSQTTTTANKTVTYGETLTLTATVTKSARTLDYVDFYVGEDDDAELLGTVKVTYTDGTHGTATLTIDTTQKKLKIGSNTITAQYGGSVNLNGSESDTITVTLNPKPVGLSWSGYDTRDYDGLQSNVTATATGIEDGDGEISVTVTDGKKTNASTHTATATELTGTYAEYYKLPTATTQEYTINPKTVTATISTIPDQTYTGRAITPQITAYDGSTLIPASEYTVDYSNNENAGTATVTLTDNTGGNYTVSGSTTFTINPKPIVATIGKIADQTYTGKAITPQITAYDDDGKTEIPTGEYTVGYANNTNAGTATVTLTDNTGGNYTVSGDTTFEILPKSIDDGATVGTFAEMTYNGTEQTPSAEVSIDGLTATGEWSKVKNVSDKTTFTASGNFTGKIDDKETGMKKLSVIIEWKNTEGLVFDNTKKTITAEVSNKKGDDVVNLAIDGDLTGTSKGTYTATVTAVNNENYTIENGQNLEKEWVISQANDNVITNLAINGWTYGNTENTPTATAKYGTPTFAYSEEENGGYAATVPTNAGTYWVKATVAGTEDYAEVSSDPISFTIAKKSIIGATVGTFAEMTYNGTEQTPSAEVSIDGLTATGEWSKVKNVSDKTTFTADGNFEGTISDITPNMEKKSVENATVALDGELTYNGQPQTQNITLTLDGFTNVTFDVSGNEQTNVKTDGDYTLTVTGTGNFSGTKTLVWNIKPYTPAENPNKKTTARVRRGRTLADATVTNGEMLGVDGVTALEGTFAWVDDTKTMSADGTEQMTFTPNEEIYGKNYATMTIDVAVSTYSSGGGGTSRYTVKFDTNGGNTITNQTVTKNSKATEPAKPTKEGYIFDGWYTDSKFTTEYDFDKKVTKNITLYAKWVEDEVQEPSDDKKDDEQKPTENEWKNPFTDVTKVDWFFDNVRYANENGLMSGVTNTTFAPNDSLTRAMLVTVLYRAEGEPAVNKSIPFADVNASQYYANAVIWAEQNGIVKGITETEFAPDENITREQIAAIIYRYAKYKGYDVSVGEDTNILSYTDFDEISEYAIEAMQYAVGMGLMKGKTESTLNPKDNATRAEIAAILGRFIKSNK